MIDSSTVPARIIIAGTSKMRLSDRFSKLASAAPAPSRSQPRVAPAPAQTLPIEEVFEDYYEPLPRPTRPQAQAYPSRRYDRQYDDYDYGRSYRRPQRPAPRIFDDSVPLIDHDLDDLAYLAYYDEMDNGGGGSFNNRSHMFRDRRSRMQRRPYYAPLTSIHSRISFKRPPPPRRNLFIRPAIRRGNYRAPPPSKRNYANRYFGGARRGGGGGGGRRGGSQWGSERKKLTPEELDRELENYMRSGRHPRIEATTT